MNLAVVFAHLLLIKTIFEASCGEIARNAIRIDVMLFLQSELDASFLGYIPKRILYFEVGVNLLQPIEKRPTHDAHERRIFERLVALYFELDLTVMISGMTGRAQSDQIVRSIAARLPTFDMVNVENRIARLAMAMLALVTVSKQYIFAHITKIILLAPLILDAADVGIFDLLNVKRRGLDDNFDDRKNFTDVVNDLKMSVDLVFDGGHEPTFGLLTIAESVRTIAGFIAATSVPKFSPRCDQGDDIIAKLNVGRVKFLFDA